MAKLILKPARISQRVIDKIKEDVKFGVFPNDNKAINEILKQYYSIPSEFEIIRPGRKQTKK